VTHLSLYILLRDYFVTYGAYPLTLILGYRVTLDKQANAMFLLVLVPRHERPVSHVSLVLAFECSKAAACGCAICWCDIPARKVLFEFDGLFPCFLNRSVSLEVNPHFFSLARQSEYADYYSEPREDRHQYPNQFFSPYMQIGQF